MTMFRQPTRQSSVTLSAAQPHHHWHQRL